jgi:hypothetical protein
MLVVTIENVSRKLEFLNHRQEEEGKVFQDT